MSPPIIRKRKWASFSLRAFLVFISLIAVWLAWYVPRVRIQQKAVQWVNRLQGHVIYDHELDAKPLGRKAVVWPAVPESLVDRLGVDWFSTVREVNLYVEQPIDDLSVIAGLRGLRRIQARHVATKNLDALSGLSEIEEIVIVSSDIEDISGVAKLRRLKRFVINGPVKSLEPLRRLRELEVVAINLSKVADVSPLSEIKSLTRIELFQSNISDLAPLIHLSNLETLDISLTQVSDISALRGHTQLKKLKAVRLAINDWTPLRHLKKLESLNVQDSPFTDLTLLSNMKGLVRLQICNHESPVALDLQPLNELPSLTHLILFNTPVENVDALKKMPILKTLDVRGTKDLSDEFLKKLQVDNPALWIPK